MQKVLVGFYVTFLVKLVSLVNKGLRLDLVIL